MACRSAGRRPLPRALIAGANGQLGRALRAAAPTSTEVLALDRRALDIGNEANVARMIAEFRPDLLFNAAAYTAVDLAEREPERARHVNATAVGYLARAVDAIGARLIHVSTDFVFDGASGIPYSPASVTAPLNVYGQTKREGEQAAGSEALIVRAGWIHAAGSMNFVTKMLQLMAERTEIGVVTDQIGTPTHAPGLATTLWRLAQDGVRGTFHYSDSGIASWYDFAVAIREEALAMQLLQRAATILPIGTEDYPTPARRPPFAVLDKRSTWQLLGHPAPHWRAGLRETLKGMANLG